MKNLISIFALTLAMSFAYVPQAEAGKGKNPEVKAYHKKTKKMFTCSLCPPKGLKKLLPKAWR